MVAIGTSDISHLGQVMDVSARFAGAIVSFLLVSVILLHTSMTLGLVVLIGVPVLMLFVGPLLAPLQRRSAHQRELTGDLSNTASDIVGGLRVLRGIGGEQVFHDRYRRESQTTRRAGVEVAKLQSVLDALQVFLPGVFVVVVVWIGARYAVSGTHHCRRAGRVLRLRRVPDDPAAHRDRVRQQVHPRPGRRASRVCRVLALTPDVTDPAVAGRPAAARRRPGRRPVGPARSDPVPLTAIVSDDPDESARSPTGSAGARPTMDDDVTAGRRTAHRAGARRGTPAHRRLRHRRHPVLRTARRPARRRPAPATSRRALDTASADDILDALPEGLDAVVTERGRSFSGGQRQRLVLVRALTADPEILVLVEPTSAVDAHTEARIAARLRQHRAGRTTVVTSTSPLMLDAVDEVVLLIDGRVVATGSHGDLLGENAAYRAVVTRETELQPSEVADDAR